MVVITFILENNSSTYTEDLYSTKLSNSSNNKYLKTKIALPNPTSDHFKKQSFVTGGTL